MRHALVLDAVKSRSQTCMFLLHAFSHPVECASLHAPCRSNVSSSEGDAALKDATVRSFADYMQNPAEDAMHDDNEAELPSSVREDQPRMPAGLHSTKYLEEAAEEEDEENNPFDDMVRRMQNKTTINALDRQLLDAAKDGDCERIRDLRMRGANVNAREPGNCVLRAWTPSQCAPYHTCMPCGTHDCT